MNGKKKITLIGTVSFFALTSVRSTAQLLFKNEFHGFELTRPQQTQPTQDTSVLSETSLHMSGYKLRIDF